VRGQRSLTVFCKLRYLQKRNNFLHGAVDFHGRLPQHTYSKLPGGFQSNCPMGGYLKHRPMRAPFPTVVARPPRRFEPSPGNGRVVQSEGHPAMRILRWTEQFTSGGHDHLEGKVQGITSRPHQPHTHMMDRHRGSTQAAVSGRIRLQPRCWLAPPPQQSQLSRQVPAQCQAGELMPDAMTQGSPSRRVRPNGQLWFRSPTPYASQPHALWPSAWAGPN